ncbi:MAG: DUF2344 domain-containing protein [Lachnospiraceae bacterium]|nr:DUF2344 domain-containing protein [Lachnospiraceae bacterium]
MKVRIRFRKTGPVRFIGHLDVMRYFQKLIRRAGLPVAYSAGFHPHQIMSFAQPLGVGLESMAEYADVEMTEDISGEEAVRALNAVSAPGIEIVSVRQLPEGSRTAMSIVAAAAYRIRFSEALWERLAAGEPALSPEGLPVAWDAFLSRETIPVVKKTKKSEETLDLKPFLFASEADAEGEIFFLVQAGSERNIRPEMPAGEFLKGFGAEAGPADLKITRLDLYARGEDGRLVSLEEMGA